MIDKGYRERIERLKMALLGYLGINVRYYGELTRIEQSVEDLAQALNTRLDQLMLCIERGCKEPDTPESPREKLANRLMETATQLTKAGRVDVGMADDFENALDAFDLAANLRRQSETVKDTAESAAIRHKRSR